MGPSATGWALGTGELERYATQTRDEVTHAHKTCAVYAYEDVLKVQRRRDFHLFGSWYVN